MQLIPLILMVVILSPLASGSTTYYVSTSGNNNNAGTNPSKAFADIQTGVNKAVPGDTITVLPGTYTITNDITISNRWGSSTTWITIQSSQGRTNTKLISETYNTFNFLNASYWIVNGFELAYTGTISPADGGGNGVTINKGSHHITIQNLNIHDFGGGGIGTINADYVTVEGNLIHNTTYNSIYGNSAISLFESIAVDNKAGYHFVVRNNVAWDNFNILPCSCASNQDITDGNCIILDTQPNFSPATLVENNICMNNGARCLHIAFGAQNVDFFNNVCYKNDAGPAVVKGIPAYNDDGELTALGGGTNIKNVRYINNIVIPYNTTKIAASISGTTSGTVYFNTNMYSGTSLKYIPPFNSSSDKLNANVKFTNPQITWPAANFTLQAGSPAIGAGGCTRSGSTDFNGNPRPECGADLGAYQSTTTSSSTNSSSSNSGGTSSSDNSGGTSSSSECSALEWFPAQLVKLLRL